MLRELYLVPFEACVREAGGALVMAAYNKVNGVPMTEHARLLRDVLKDEWGFDGVVMSDWHAARSTGPPPWPPSTWPCRARTGRGEGAGRRRSPTARSPRRCSTTR